jgi:predicted AlkP superfamily phosphohydrolase/phosphomutase
MAAGDLPNLARLAAGGSFRRIRSVHPTVSSCAWASFMTGLDPGGHGIYGFVDRRPGTGELFVPTGRDLRAETLWERLSRLGKRVVVINVPGTYPPRPVNGVLVACFLCTDPEKLSTDPRVRAVLREVGYRTDMDAWEARRSPDGVAVDAADLLDRRAAAALRFLESEPWDFFMVHFMALDRLQHFLKGPADGGDPRHAPGFLEAWRRADAHAGTLVERAGPGVEVVLLSDHGFCAVKRQVQVNRWLEEEGFLAAAAPRDPRAGLRGLDGARTRAFSLLPGRIYLNLRGRERDGSVEPGAEAARLRREIAERLLDWRDPADGARVIRAVHAREDLYRGAEVHRAPDLVAEPEDGYDLKGRFGVERVFEEPGAITGMHTHGDAFLLLRDGAAPAGDLSITDAHGILCRMMGVDAAPAPRPA